MLSTPVFGLGVFVTLLFIIGFGITIREFRNLNEEDNRPRR